MIAMEGGWKQFGKATSIWTIPIHSPFLLFSSFLRIPKKERLRMRDFAPYSARFIVFFAVRQFAIILVSSQDFFGAKPERSEV